MTREEAIDLLDSLVGMVEDNHKSDYDTALQMAIKALEELPKRRNEAKLRKNKSALAKQYKWERDIAIDQLHTLGYEFGEKVEPCEDAISRQAVCKIIDDIRQKIDGLRYDHFIGNVSNYAVIDTALEIIDAHIAEEQG